MAEVTRAGSHAFRQVDGAGIELLEIPSLQSKLGLRYQHAIINQAQCDCSSCQQQSGLQKSVVY